MIKKILSLAAAAFLCSTSASAQMARTINLTYSPVGMKNLFFTYSDTKEKYKYSYNYTAVGSFEFQRQYKGHLFLSKLSVGKFKASSKDLNYGDLNGNFYKEQGAPDFDVNEFQDGLDFSFMQYGGRTINPGKRFQMPFYYGVGFSYLQGAPVHNLTFDLGLTLRAKYYFTDNFAIHAGASGVIGWGLRDYELFEDKDEGATYTVGNRKLMLDLGLSYSF